MTHTSHIEALERLRGDYLDRRLSYREMAELLTAYSSVYIQKSNVWNAQHRAKRCPKAIRLGLERMGLLQCKPRRYRLFYEMSEEEYKIAQAWLKWQGWRSYTEFMETAHHWCKPWEVG